ncbi:hypothetical protein LTR47_006603 [Exophiala xenobiotica]|nr:hypothetical protein LTR92_007500 [Exophiala xenobiotica]KAK5207661.1 hypothetical protein LTR41_006705 [Exophiala xenobiotica]KAK5220686.1 hypothetical protein LTR72_007308 [Exophiala xenobiotica]KAK5232390.1 hypothetical protein LTR47_006603 [Exophiala xenobiotica]KAK5290958.1 hypothetical protein LTR14_006465 [Exophiala xenobiotica]
MAVQSVTAYRLTAAQLTEWLRQKFGATENYNVRLVHDKYHFNYSRPLTRAEREDLDDLRA